MQAPQLTNKKKKQGFRIGNRIQFLLANPKYWGMSNAEIRRLAK
jgi:hypothetical protein